jgi:hypothetical protein
MANRTYHERGKTVHGFRVREHPLYFVWAGMLARCFNPNSEDWVNYGGRGIRVDPRWYHFENFAADMHPHPGGVLSLDRIDVNGRYERANCRWADKTEQCVNRRRFKNNTTGHVGVVAVTNQVTRYEARFDRYGVRYQIGRFPTAEAAHAAREAFIGLFEFDQAAALDMLEEPTTWCTSTTKVRGVTPHRDGGFVARTTVGGVRHYLGYFQTIDEAAQVIQDFKKATTV